MSEELGCYDCYWLYRIALSYYEYIYIDADHICMDSRPCKLSIIKDSWIINSILIIPSASCTNNIG